MQDIEQLLVEGTLELQGLIPWSSNYTFLVTLRRDAQETLAIYKPYRGERPLYDFPTHSLCRREVAAYQVSQQLGWPAIPPVVLRQGPHGLGSLQFFIEADYEEHYFTLRERPELEPAFRRIALFDYVTNNADRKGGHILKEADGQIWAIDNALTFHVEPKLRTVIWEYAGQPIEPSCLEGLEALRQILDDDAQPLCQALVPLISHSEVEMLKRRLDELVQSGVYPLPREDWRNWPYPLV
jgi:uncharacterized repeat protein (TIGR03843 family)